MLAKPKGQLHSFALRSQPRLTFVFPVSRTYVCPRKNRMEENQDSSEGTQ